MYSLFFTCSRTGVYSPTQNRIYLAPYSQAQENEWHYIDMISNASTPKLLMAGPLFNKF